MAAIQIAEIWLKFSYIQNVGNINIKKSLSLDVDSQNT